MPAQQQLFSNLPPVPTYVPLHEAFKGSCRVFKHSAKDLGRDYYRVNLDTGTCQCEHGHAFVWDEQKAKYFSTKYCVHKLKAMADIVEREPDALWGYTKALATRYNVFETVSAFHKELRRGDVSAAWYWASVLATFRGLEGVARYMLNIVYEETRDHDLANHLLDQCIRIKTLTRPPAETAANVCNAVRWFCLSPKKWNLAHRMHIFEAEMRAYKQLITLYGKNVARPGNVIPTTEAESLQTHLIQGLQGGNKVNAQIGLKGLLKLECPEDEQEEHRLAILELINEHTKRKQSRLFEFVVKRASRGYGIGYHEVNMFLDAAMGEPSNDGVITDKDWNSFANTRELLPLELGKVTPIPLYAHDNHTYSGKALIRRFPGELEPGAKQTNLDLRWCGAYFGVAWRMLAFNQFKKPVEWGEVKWPRWLFATVNDLWY